MKLLLSTVLLSALLIIAACKKDTTSNNTLSTSTWTFKGTSYSGDSCELYNGFFEAWPNGSGGLTNYIYISFPYNSLPSTGTYRVVSQQNFYNSTPVNIALVSIARANGDYVSTGFGNNQTLTVTTDNNHKVTVTGTGIMLQAASNDSSTLDLKMVQTF